MEIFPRTREKLLSRGLRKTSSAVWWQPMLQLEDLISLMSIWLFRLSHQKTPRLTFIEPVELPELESQVLASPSGQ